MPYKCAFNDGFETKGDKITGLRKHVELVHKMKFGDYEAQYLPKKEPENPPPCMLNFGKILAISSLASFGSISRYLKSK